MGRVAILHFASPPIVGGVESTIAYHARGLADLGHEVRVVSGSGAPFDERIQAFVNPLFGSTHSDILAVKKQLDMGQVPSEFENLREHLRQDLLQILQGCDVCIAHNVHSLNKNLPLTAALHQLGSTIRMVAWCHDLAWTNSQYIDEMHPGYPWDLLRQAWPGTQYVTVSEPRRIELAALLGVSLHSIEVILPGLDLGRFFHWTATTHHLVSSLNLLSADTLLLLPARLTRRKNIALALEVLGALRGISARDIRLIVTGPPGPHNPANPGYLGELLSQRESLNLQDSAHFVYACGIGDEPLVPDDDTMANLYQLADALFFPTLQEGFGIPILEAGLAGIPVFCSDIPPLRATGQGYVNYFDPINETPEKIAQRMLTALEQNSSYHLRIRVRRMYRWESIIRDQILPVLGL